MVAAEIEQERTLIVRAIQDGWVMGDDLVLQVTGAETVIEVQEMIKAKKGIGVTRMVLHKQDSPKPLEDRYYSWDLNRVSLYDGCVLEVHPNRANNWLWHPIAWYEAALLNSARPQCDATSRVAYATHSRSAK
eukprot:5866-Heterococcus_DN1.PRE.5